MKSCWDNRACLDYAIENGILQGIAKGEAIGIEKGMKEGMEKGMEKSKFEIAKSMKLKELDLNLIAECTGLSAEEIEEL